MTQSNLGGAHADLPTGDRGNNLRQAITCYQAAARGYDAVGMTNQADRARTSVQGLEKQLKKIYARRPASERSGHRIDPEIA
jgi:hypothetical protein